MKSLPLLLSLILLCSTSWSATKRSTDYAAYFDGILNAEHKLSNDQLAPALDVYMSLFRKYDFVFARDAYNALQLVILTSGSAQRDSLLLLCASSGVPDSMLSRNELVQGAYKNNSSRFQQLYARGHAAYMQRIDTALRAEMRLRYKREQASKGKSNYREICTDNFNRIRELSKQGRFPAEQVIGIDDDLNYGVALPTLLHYPYAYVLLHDYLWAAVHKGQLQPLSLMYLYGFNQTRTSALYTNSIPVDTEHFKVRYNIGFGLQSADQNALDSARRKVWLRPQAEKQAILIVAQKHRIDFREGW
jgi:hypothetical protein